VKKIRIFDYHHQVLEAWEECFREKGIAPRVLSLDFHTDVLNSARRGIGFPTGAKEAVEVLHHDEHFDWALRAGVISKAVIIALSPCAVAPEHPALEVRRSGSLPEMEVILNEPEKFRDFAENVLDDRFLEPLLSDGFPSEPYILDIDCDYLLCRKALEPAESSLFDHLAENAQLITLCRENEWVKILKLPGENITGESIADTLVSRWKK
jgi:hypothetical protein